MRNLFYFTLSFSLCVRQQTEGGLAFSCFLFFINWPRQSRRYFFICLEISMAPKVAAKGVR